MLWIICLLYAMPTWTKTSGYSGAAAKEVFTDDISDTLSNSSGLYYVYRRGDGGSELWRLQSNTIYISEYQASKRLDSGSSGLALKNSSTEIPYFVFGVNVGYSWPIASGNENINGADVVWFMTGKYKGLEDVIGTTEAGPFPNCPKIIITKKITTKQGQNSSVREEIHSLWFSKDIGIVRETFEIRENGVSISTKITSLLEWYIPGANGDLFISGVVTDSTGAKVPNVKLVLTRTDAVSEKVTVYSSKYGTYSFKGIAQGNYLIVPELNDNYFMPDTLKVTLTNKALTGQNFQIVQPPDLFTISGSVISKTGTPLEGVALTLSNGQTDTTDALGHFSISDVVKGTYWITPHLSEYAFSPDSMMVKVLNTNITNISFTGTRGSFTVSGIVKDTENKPLEGVTVYLEDGRSFVTGASGYYTFTSVPQWQT